LLSGESVMVALILSKACTLTSMTDQLLRAFRATFVGQRYLHRRAYTGDFIASHLYEDLLTLHRSAKLVRRIEAGELAVNNLNRVRGREGRRGDGTLGTVPPGAPTQAETGFKVLRGPVATLEIAAEVKIVATKLTAQIDRVMSDLTHQADVFRSQSDRAIRVALVGVNFAHEYTGYEGAREHIAKSPPGREAPDIVRRLRQFVTPSFDELVLLQFRATNRDPFAFDWVNEGGAKLDYGSALVRISDEYERRF
jgi:hypothetical protein